MCTLLLLRRAGSRLPLLLAANRDERIDRPWLPPGRHWLEHPGVIAGQDRLAGGSWLGLNDQGVVAAVTNRTGTLGPEAGRKSRGELVLWALRHADAQTAAEALASLSPADYRPFNLVIADAKSAWWIAHRERRSAAELKQLPEGLSMLTDGDLNDPDSPRIGRYLPRFQAAETPDPSRDEGWRAWQHLLASRDPVTAALPRTAMTLADGQFGTLSSSLMALPATRQESAVWLFAPGPPDRTRYQQIPLS